MKYWLLTTEYPPLHGGGISTYCFFTARMLAEAGHQVTLFINNDSIADYTIINESENIRIIQFNINRSGMSQSLGYTALMSYAFAGIVKQLIEKEGKPDYIESQDYLGIAYYLTQCKHIGEELLSGIPIIITLHSPAFIYLEYNRVPLYRFPDYWTGEMEKQSIAAADAIISPTHFMLQKVNEAVCMKAKQTTVIPNPFRISNSPAPMIQKNKIVYYGKLSAQKGSFALLEYFKEMWDEGFPHPLHVIGGTDIVFYPEMKTMGQLVRNKYGGYIDKGLLQLHGKIQPSQIDNYLADAHVIIVPSIVDNMPYVVMESMSRRKVVLASVQGGQREMIRHGETGFLFDHNEKGSFAKQLSDILSMPKDQLLHIADKASNSIGGNYSFETVWRQKKDFLKSVRSIPAGHFPFLYQEKINTVPELKTISGLLSVVIPFYNMGSYIDECIQSVISSGYQEIEILIINDGSTDAYSVEKLRELADKKGITVINTQNQGVASARNSGAKKANGEFLAFLDADDKVAAAYYEKAIALLSKKENVFFAGAWVQYFENSNQVWPAFTPQPPYALLHNPVNSSSLVYKRSAFLAGGLNDKNAGYGLEDYESMIQLLQNGYNGVVLPEILFYYRVRKGSMFRNISNEKLLYSNKYISEKHSQYYAKYALPVIQLLNANGPGYLYDNPTFETKVSVESGPPNRHLEKIKKYIKQNETLKKNGFNTIKD